MNYAQCILLGHYCPVKTIFDSQSSSSSSASSAEISSSCCISSVSVEVCYSKREVEYRR